LLKLFFIFVACSFIHNITLGQSPPNLGTATSFALFTGTGAFDNLEATHVIGDIGSHTYSPTGFPPGTVVGSIYNASDGITATASTDVGLAYGYMSTLGGTVLGVTLGSGQILTPGVYNTGAAATLNGNLTLDAEGDPNALFIIRIGGAFATGTYSNVILINSASLCNVYWQINGQFDLGNGSVFRGTVIVNGAILFISEVPKKVTK